MERDEDDKPSPLLKVIYGSQTNLPRAQRNVVRIFVSSTFTDMKVERNMLMSSVYPRLKKYCLENYKLEFQVVDMRWGVQDQASDDHSTSELCMREIYNCQRESAGPYFVCLLGDRYGTRYLKKFITEEHWIILVSRIRSSEVKQLLDVWYKLDTNSATAHRILQPISCVENGKEQWQKSSSIMYNTLRDAAIQAMNDGELSTEIAQTFIRSVTEEEVDCAGMLSDTHNDNKPKCLAFMRRINNINIQNAKAGRFIDLNDSREIDEESQALLNKLRERVKEEIPRDNVREYSVNWSDNEGIDAAEHTDYLNSFGEDFYDQVKRLVDFAVESRDEKSTEVYKNDVTREVLNHSKQALDKLSKVVPRSDILDNVKAYITGDSDQPLVIHGHSGCGKTSIMASVANEAGQWLSDKEDKPGTAVILRFLGTTPSSSDMEHLLRSLIAQLRMIAEQDCEIDCSDLTSQSLANLINTFKEHMEEFDRKSRQLVIIVDSIDQLTKNDMAFNLSWLPRKLPNNVKFIISTLPDIYGILESAHSLDIPKQNFVEVKALDEKSAWTIIDKWLEMSDRKITKEQRELITGSLKNRSLPPLYIKLVFDILVKWTSYSQTVSIPTDVISCMDQLFTDLESTHGKIPVQLALAYLTCCPGGISEVELDDVLSIDDKFLTIVYQYHIPPVRRIPPTLWVRIKNDIRDYLVEKESSGVNAWYWYHRQFIEYATRRYGSEKGDNTRHCMDTLCEYFTSKWSETPKSFTYTQQQMKKLNISDPSAVALRYVTPQPTRYGRHRFNTRKVSVLSQLWSNSIMKDEVYKNSAAYIMDIEFLTGKFVDDSWSNVDAELSAFSEFMSESELQPLEGPEEERYRVEFRYIHAVLKMYSGLISMAPLALSAQLFACLQDKYNLSPPIPPSGANLPNVAWFLTQLTVGTGVDMSPMLPVSKILDSPGGMHCATNLHTNFTVLLPFTYQGKSAVALFADEMVVYLIEGDCEVSVYMTIALPFVPEHGQFVSVSDNENFIVGDFEAYFFLISLEKKRVEVLEQMMYTDPDGNVRFYGSEQVHVFINPLLSGKDCIMLYAWLEELLVIFSFKQIEYVWWQEIMRDGDGDVNGFFYHVSAHDTEVEYIKSLVIVKTNTTEFYEMKLLEDGGVNVTKQREIPNAFTDVEPKQMRVGNDVASSFHRQKQMDLVVSDLPGDGILTFSDRVAVAKGEWSYYKVTKACKMIMSGKLKNGDDVVAIDFDQGVVELFTAKSHDSLTLSACIDYDGKCVHVYVVPQSDVLILATTEKTSVYFLSTDNPPGLDVTLAFDFESVCEAGNDLLADPKGFLAVTNKTENCSKIFDLMAFLKPREKAQKHRLIHWPNQITDMGASALTVLTNQYVWDLETNDLLSADLPGCKESEQTRFSLCMPGEGEWKYTVAIIKVDNELVVTSVSPSTDSPMKLTSELLCTVPMKSEYYSYQFNNNMISLDGTSGAISLINMEHPTEPAITSSKLITTTGPTEADEECTWETAGFNAFRCCFVDDLFLVGGNARDPADNFADTHHSVLVFNSSDFKLIRKLSPYNFSASAFFQVYKLVIFIDFNSKLFVMDLSDTESLQIERIKLEKDEKFTMIDSYENFDESYSTSTQPYFYVFSDKRGLLKLDLRVYRLWSEGDGVIQLGQCPTTYRRSWLSKGHQYLAGVTDYNSKLQLVRLKESETELLGEIIFQGIIVKLQFLHGDRYMAMTVGSNDFLIVKIVDPTKPDDLITEAERLPCARNQPHQTKEELLKDSRWTAMTSVVEDGGAKRDENTLHNFVKDLVMPSDRPEDWKPKLPRVGTEEFLSCQAFSAMIDPETKKYVPIVVTVPLDFETVLQQQQHQQATVNENPPTTSLPPSPQPTTQQSPRPPSQPASQSPPLLHSPHPPNQPKPTTPQPTNVQMSDLPQTSTLLPTPPKQAKKLSATGTLSAANKESHPRLPPGVKRGKLSHPQQLQEETVPTNLKLYQGLPTEERGKRLDAAVAEINQDHTAVCVVL